MLGGDPHALDVDRPLHTLIVALLTAEAEFGDASAREVWRTYGVIVDPVSSTVACLNLHPDGDGRLARLLRLMYGSHTGPNAGACRCPASPKSWSSTTS
jgi:hypothetical protein